MVQIKVLIDNDGDVVSATIFKDDLASVLSAATSVYTPETKGCTPAAGAYLFRAEFRRRP